MNTHNKTSPQLRWYNEDHKISRYFPIVLFF
ncbi:tryptophanase leader peptide [Vibrio algarum]